MYNLLELTIKDFNLIETKQIGSNKLHIVEADSETIKLFKLKKNKRFLIFNNFELSQKQVYIDTVLDYEQFDLNDTMFMSLNECLNTLNIVEENSKIFTKTQHKIQTSKDDKIKSKNEDFLVTIKGFLLDKINNFIF